MYISDLKVQEFVELPADQTPIIATAEDILSIDCSKSIIYKNGEPFYQALHPASTFFKLNTGRNGIAVSEDDADVRIAYQERWL
jgi:phage-related protein